MSYAIRPFRTDDATAVAELTLAAIRDVGARKYTLAQVDAWAARHPCPDRFVTRHDGGSMIFVACDVADEPVAYTLLEPDGHLDMLYCRPDHTRKGLANELLAHAEMIAQSRNIARLFTEASELAVPAFERAGYAVMHRRDFEIEGIPIHNYAMEKLLG